MTTVVMNEKAPEPQQVYEVYDVASKVSPFWQCGNKVYELFGPLAGELVFWEDEDADKRIVLKTTQNPDHRGTYYHTLKVSLEDYPNIEALEISFEVQIIGCSVEEFYPKNLEFRVAYILGTGEQSFRFPPEFVQAPGCKFFIADGKQTAIQYQDLMGTEVTYVYEDSLMYVVARNLALKGETRSFTFQAIIAHYVDEVQTPLLSKPLIIKISFLDPELYLDGATNKAPYLFDEENLKPVEQFNCTNSKSWEYVLPEIIDELDGVQTELFSEVDIMPLLALNN